MGSSRRARGLAAAVLASALAAPAGSASPPAPAAGGSYEEGEARWRAEREKKLRADGGWLSVAGLFWLKEGDNHFGSGPACDVRLPASAPLRAGTFELRGGTVTARVEPGVQATSGGKAVSTLVLRPDTAGSPDVLQLGPLSMHVIARGSRLGIRLKDAEAPARREFPGLSWFPVDPAWRVVARFEPHARPRAIPVPNVLGEVSDLQSPGVAVFTLQGRELRLHPVLEEPGAQELFFIFSDLTARTETYGGGRFLDAALPKDGEVVLDFNRAYSPPCAFTAFATCPLPPRENRLDVRVEAGERRPPRH